MVLRTGPVRIMAHGQINLQAAKVHTCMYMYVCVCIYKRLQNKAGPRHQVTYQLRGMARCLCVPMIVVYSTLAALSHVRILMEQKRSFDTCKGHREVEGKICLWLLH